MTLTERAENLRKMLPHHPEWYGTVLPDPMNEWNIIQWEQILGLYKPPYVPTFRKVTGTDGQMVWPLPDSDYFATMETAQKMADLYGDGAVFEVPFGGDGGLFSVDAKEYHTLVNGTSRNTGLIAAYYKRMPEDQFPGAADRAIRLALGLS